MTSARADFVGLALVAVLAAGKHAMTKEDRQDKRESRIKMPSRGYYKWLGNDLITDQELWQAFYERCRVMSAAGLYGHRNPNTVAAAVLKGYSLGMDFMESLSKIKVIRGNPVLRGPQAIAHIHAVVQGAKCRPLTNLLRLDGVGDLDRQELAQRLKDENPACWIGDRLDPCLISVWSMERPGWDRSIYTFTMQQADLAGLTTRNENWTMYPDRCLKWQAASVGAQEMFGDELGGMYLAEELENSPKRKPQENRAQDSAEIVERAVRPDRREPSPELTKVGEELRAYRVSYSKACMRCFGRQLGSSLPTPEEVEALLGFCDQLNEWRGMLSEGSTVEGFSMSVYPTSYDRHRPVVEKNTGEGKDAVWSGSARIDVTTAVVEGAHAGVLALLGEPIPKAPDDDEPDEDAIEKANQALESARAENKRRQDARREQPVTEHESSEGDHKRTTAPISELVSQLENEDREP